jgi:PKD repeat protein
MSIRELFRQKLEYAEIIPDASVNSKLMRNLARKEFVHFNPFRFNIYYLGGMLIVGITAAIVLTSRVEKSDNHPVLNISDSVSNPVRIENSRIPDGQIFVQKADIKKGIISESRPPRSKTKPENLTLKEANKNTGSRQNENANITEVSDSLTKKGLFTGSSVGKNKLQSNLKSDESLFESSLTKGCAPLKIQFKSKPTGIDSCQWTFGDGGSSNNKNPEWIFDVEGEYKVVLKAFDSGGSETTSSTIITVYPKPLARFEIFPDKAVLPDDEVHFINYSVDGMKYKWDFGDGNTSDLAEPYHKYAKSGKYNVQLIVSSESGCSDSLTVLNAFSGSEFYIDFPNAFIPNTEGPSGGFYSSKSDETAQVFHPAFSGVSDYHLKIFSRLGILIFESNDINIGWDGYFKGQLSNPGVYIWKVRGNFRNGESFVKMGDVTLLMN